MTAQVEQKSHGRIHRMSQVQGAGTETLLVFICPGFILIVQLKNISLPTTPLLPVQHL